MQVPQWVKPGVWGVVIGVVGIMILGFAWGGWVLGSTAESMAQEQANAAVVAVLTPICVAKFMAQPEATMKLAELQNTAVWNQKQVVEKGGWATVPGSTTPNSVVASACLAQLIKTAKT
jgi:Ni/Fe-hydrogenase subunit HybB-like protein